MAASEALVSHFRSYPLATCNGVVRSVGVPVWALWGTNIWERWEVMSQKPRNPRYFPKMKVRGFRNRRNAHIEFLQMSYDNLNKSYNAFIAKVNARLIERANEGNESND